MFTDPFVASRDFTTITPNASQNLSIPRSSNDNSKALYRYQDADMNDWLLSFGHQYGRTRNRFTARVDLSGLVPSTSVPSENSAFSQSVYCVFDAPTSGPIVNTTTALNLDRKMCNILGSLLVSVAADPTFLARVVKGGEM